ncbi:UDP-N-acetylmuramoyl-tripeptide--D-alanyl-D-alanine ligase [Patescibacteria group bacterium AH-259-L07]|nr:UDP-N-acetylmuramoyl-tripeptide--D-alanyl-D-alanine ligase [Patescibacteria group bacterium AH-259-L07]
MVKLLQKVLAFFSKRILKKYKPLIIGITGSVGKSSTKEAIYVVLKDSIHVRRSLKNYNNEIGVPLTILGALSPGKSLVGWLHIFWNCLGMMIFRDKSYPKALILEMAADRVGDIEYLTTLAPPQRAVVTAISPAHTEFLGNLDNVAKEKQAIVTHLPAAGWAVLNADDEKVLEMRNKTSAKIITFGISEDADVRAVEISLEQELVDKQAIVKGLYFKVTHAGSVVPVFLPNVIATAQIYAILAGVATAITFEVNLIEISEALQDYRPLHGRMVPIEGKDKTLIIDDTYNSSPQAALSALEALDEINIYSEAQKLVVLGDMRELGSISEEEHYVLGKKVAKMGFNRLITVGEEAKEIARGARRSGMSKDAVVSFDTFEGVSQFLKSHIREGDVILLKGSQVVRMEHIVKGIMAKPRRAKKLLTRQGEEWL